jgi:hypothetical protein
MSQRFIILISIASCPTLKLLYEHSEQGSLRADRCLYCTTMLSQGTQQRLGPLPAAIPPR